MLNILSHIQQNSKIHIDYLSQVIGLNKQNTQLWLYTLAGMRYIKKISASEYIITQRGINELIYHHYHLPRDEQDLNII